MMIKKIFYAFSFLLLVANGAMQAQTIKGKIIDSETQKALPFVNIIFGSENHGCTSDIDGEFEITSPETEIYISYIGYFSDTIYINKKTQSYLLIELAPKLYNIEEVIILPGENPANRIIEKVVDNRDINNPEKMNSFSLRSYNKMIFTVEKDTTNLPDSLKYKKTKVEEAYENQHLLLLETVNKKEFLQPDQYNEEIIASKVSGFNDPIFSLIASQVQAFSFYNDFFELLDKSYINPISKGSARRYLFILEDTLYTAENDSVFVISFRPRKGKTFEGLKGFLHINTNKYAIQSVVAEPLEMNQGMRISIRQNYQFIDKQQWFPKELTTKIVWEKALTDKPYHYNMIANGKTYISDIELNPAVNKKSFSNVEVKIADDANKQTTDYWDENRTKPLSEIEKETYRIIDSISKAENLDKKLAGIETILTGKIPYKFVDIPLNKLFDYNEYEGFRLGLGFMTNAKISKIFSLGGYANYGFNDKAWKYGGDLIFNLHKNSESKIHFSYVNDVIEKSGYQFLEKPDFTSTEIYRKYFIENMDLIEKYQVSFGALIFKYLKFNLFLNQSDIRATDNYSFGETLTESTNQFSFSEIGIKLRYAYNEKYMQTLRARYTLGTNYPILYANFTKGTNWFNGEYEYTKIEARASKTFKTKSLGKTKITLVGGLADGNIPISKLYNGHGSYQPFSFEAENSFGTMRMGEFYSDRFFSVFFKHDFGYLFKTELFSPKLAIVNNYGIATLSNKQNHFDTIELKSYDKGYYECGLMLNNILNQSFTGLGFAVFYRYGTYAFDKTADNFAYKISFTFSL